MTRILSNPLVTDGAGCTYAACDERSLGAGRGGLVRQVVQDNRHISESYLISGNVRDDSERLSYVPEAIRSVLRPSLPRAGAVIEAR